MNEKQINDLIAVKVMGWNLEQRDYSTAWVDEEGQWFLKQLWKPCTDIRDAFVVIEKLRKENDFWFELTTPESWSLKYRCYFQLDEMEVHAVEETAPLAICKAALKAFEVEVVE